MTYLRPHSSKLGRNKTVTILVISLFATVIAFIQFFAPQVFPALFSGMASPFWRTEFVVGSGALKSSEQLLSENESLRRQIADMNVNLAFVKAVEQENGELKTLMGRASSTPKILSAVLIRPPYSDYDIFVIDIGAEYNLGTTSKVYAGGSMPIGRISEISDSTSKVMLFSSPGLKYDVLIGRNHLAATAFGRGGGQFEAELPRGANVSEGDFVIAPALNTMPLGVVTTVKSDPAEPFETVIFAPPINIYGLRWVLVDSITKRK